MSSSSGPEWLSGFTTLQRRVESARSTRSSSEDPAVATAIANRLFLKRNRNGISFGIRGSGLD